MSGDLSPILRRTSFDDHEQILKEAESVLRQSPADVQAQHIKVIALLKLDRYEAAVHAFEDGGNALKDENQLAWIYALYKSGSLKEAETAVTKSLDPPQSLTHIEAQLAYRSEKFQRAADIYESLTTSTALPESALHDLRVNRGATHAQIMWAKGLSTHRTVKAMTVDLEQFETAFNVACAYIAQGNLKQAEFLLSRAKELCLRANDLSETEKDAENLPITVQQIYVSSQLGNLEKAEKLYGDIKHSSVADISTRHIAKINIMAASSAVLNPYLYDRLNQLQSTATYTDSAFKFQKSVLSQNQKSIDLMTGKISSVLSSTMSILSRNSSDAINPQVTTASNVNAAAHSRNSKGRAALKQMLPLLKNRPEEVGLLLTVMQLYLLSNNVDTATSLLESFFARLESTPGRDNLKIRFAPGLVAILVTLYTKSNRFTHAKAELMKAAGHWRLRTMDGWTSGPLLAAAGVALLQNPSVEELQMSHELFQLMSTFDQSSCTIAGLSASAGLGSKDELNSARSLPAATDLAANVDAAELEREGVPRVLAAHAPHSSKRVMLEKVEKAREAKKVRRGKTSKLYDSSTPADAERWLPLRDRSYWKPRGKRKGRVAGAMATQGGVVSEDSRPATPIASQVVQQSKQKAKKGKGAK